MGKISRREFIKITGAALGGIILTGCGSGGRHLPNGYRFYRIKTTGESIGSGARSLPISSFNGTAHISSQGVLTFDAYSADGRQGIFQLGMDFSGSRPAIQWERTVVLSGETLSDGRVVSGFKAMDVNSVGNIAAVIRAGKDDSSRHYGSGLYLDADRTGFQPVFINKDEFGNSGICSTGVIGDVDLHEDNEILVVANFLSPSQNLPPGVGLFHLSGASRQAARLIMKSGDIIPATDHALSSIGLIDLHDNGYYVIQGHFSVPSGGATGDNAISTGGSLLLTGNLATVAEKTLLAFSNAVSGEIHLGESHYGPRMDPDGVPFGVIQNNNNLALIHGEQLILGTGSPSPAGGLVESITPGSIGSDGTLFYTLVSSNGAGLNLVAYDGYGHSVLLSRGDVLSDGGAAVEDIYFGTTTKHVDAQSRIVMLCAFSDGSMSLVAGIPA